jgi:cyclic pyranopterin phosphate synthase
VDARGHEQGRRRDVALPRVYIEFSLAQRATIVAKDKTKKLSHYDRAGRAAMVDVSAKAPTRREASASAFVAMSREVLQALPQNPKGNPLEVARIAGISAAKRTSELIPMCHPLALSFVDVTTEVCENGIKVCSQAATTAQTGVEMEALVAVSVAALTVYDMCKALDKSIAIREIVLERKSGGKSGEYRRSRVPPTAVKK